MDLAQAKIPAQTTILWLSQGGFALLNIQSTAVQEDFDLIIRS